MGLPKSYKRTLVLDTDDPRWKVQRKHLDDKINKVSSMLDDGFTVTNIAIEMGCSQPAMSRFIKKHFICNRNLRYENKFGK